jgi:ribonuclease J
VHLVLDVGRPLDAPLDEPLPLPAVPGFDDGDPSLLGVIISHGHPDHFGLADQLHPAVPLYIGEPTGRILREAGFFSAAGKKLCPKGFLRDSEPLDLGPFHVTPYLVDHSAFDAYALLVQADDRRLFYSGDLRAHGRKSARFEALVRDPPAGIDVLLLEGTQIGRGDESVGVQSERDLEDHCRDLFLETDGLVLVSYSSQNIDRLVTLYRAARRSGRKLVVDLYTATIAAATGRETVPQAHWDGVRVYVPQAQRICVKRSREFERVIAIRDRRLYPEDLAAQAAKLVLTFRGSMTRELEAADCLAGAHAVWSLWPGYLKQPSGEALKRWLVRQGIPLTILHTSGHATVADLKRLARAVDPGRIVPIHTAAPERYIDIFERVELHRDREWWRV